MRLVTKKLPELPNEVAKLQHMLVTKHSYLYLIEPVDVIQT